MPFAVFRCCPTSMFLKYYESSTDAVLKTLGIEFIDLKDFNCCGYPLKNFSFNASVLCSARNLSLAEARGLDIVTLCSCCYGTLTQAQEILQKDPELKKRTNALLNKEGLSLTTSVRVRHLLEVLYDDLGPEKIEARLICRFKDLHVAVQYGCHFLRPKTKAQTSRTGTPPSLDRLVEITGAKIIHWQKQFDCCGSPMLGIYNDLSADLKETKIANARSSGADIICVSCVYCQLQFNHAHHLIPPKAEEKENLPSILFPQLLGLALGIDGKVLGIDQTVSDQQGIMSHLVSNGR
ncbi:MAG: CoB--CoM heterodisulfide reductase iron-sulfur subunit B family protein [Thermodesulfobacteriota bacterium]